MKKEENQAKKGTEKRIDRKEGINNFKIPC